MGCLRCPHFVVSYRLLLMPFGDRVLSDFHGRVGGSAGLNPASPTASIASQFKVHASQCTQITYTALEVQLIGYKPTA